MNLTLLTLSQFDFNKDNHENATEKLSYHNLDHAETVKKIHASAGKQSRKKESPISDLIGP